MKLTITMSSTCQQEKQYIVDVLLSDFLGIDYELNFREISSIEISANSNKKIVLPDTFFTLADAKWLVEESMPLCPLKTAKLTGINEIEEFFTEKELPVIFGELSSGDPIVKADTEKLSLCVDILGSCFFMLSRYEEVVVDKKDMHDRFAGKESISYKEKFIDRPLVNEYLEILWACIKNAWPTIDRKDRKFQSFPTHDVDHPFKLYYKSLYKTVNDLASIVTLKQKPKQVIRDTLSWLAVKKGKLDRDPYNTFDEIMNISEKHGLQSTFYFMTNKGATPFDGYYSVHDKAIIDLLVKINRRGHLIGLHCSYDSYNKYPEVVKEKQGLLTVCEQNGILLDKIRSRQHYLRWETPLTFRILEESGIYSDSTLGFADQAGFRCGTCYNFPVYDVINRKRLSLREFPLIVMERSVLDKTYMGKENKDDALKYMIELKNQCRKFQGDFIYLWHNSNIVEPEDYEMFAALTAA